MDILFHYDKLLHFIISFGFTSFLLLFFLVFLPVSKSVSPRFWESEKTFLTAIFTLILAIAFLLVITIGIGKEWLDSYGFGDVEFLDFAADFLGIVAGVTLVLRRVRRLYFKKRRISYQSTIQNSSIPLDRFIQNSFKDPSRSSRQDKDP